MTTLTTHISPPDTRHPTPDTTTALLSLGSNLGYREATLRSAAEMIAEVEGVMAVRCSSMYETEPVGHVDQPEFINCAIAAETWLAPHALLKILRAIELRLGRVAREKWHEREIDIDIVLFGDHVVDDADLVIPHPQMHRRRFVLAPLAEIAPDARHPLLDRTVTELLASCDDPSHVRKR